MRIGITGTYSSGKTLTSMAVSHFLGLSRTQARTMREILPEVAPGKALEEVSSPQLIHMIVQRHVERVRHEILHQSGFISDGCSLQEWIYGSVRIRYGINPNDSVDLQGHEHVHKTDALGYFEEVMVEIGKLVKRHVAVSFDFFIHLPNELPLARDGHRPVNERFRAASDELLRQSFDELGLGYVIVGGSLKERLGKIAGILECEPIMSHEEAISRASVEYQKSMV